MASFLEKIRNLKLEELKSAPSSAALEAMRARLTKADGRFAKALAVPAPCIIAEFKPASPSAGVLNNTRTVAEAVASYRDAAALSVLTDGNFFGSSFEKLSEVRAATDKPILCKDFIVSKFQVYRARECGADAVLLIVKLLEVEVLVELFLEIIQLGMTPVVEVQTEEELRVAESLNSDVLLINNRNLDTLEIDLETTIRLAPRIKSAKHVIAASGVETPEDIARLTPYARTFLIGSALMKSEDPADTLQQFLQSARHTHTARQRQGPRIKLCGFQNLQDASAAMQLGVDYLGLIFVDESKRRVAIQDAESICKSLKGKVKLVGVFQNTDVEHVNAIVRSLNLDYVQYHGGEAPEQCRRTVCPVIKVFDVSNDFDAAQLDQYRDCVQHFMFDRPKNSTDKSWLRKAISVLSKEQIQEEFFIAGGLDETNVESAISELRPFAVDAASSVENSPGVKDPHKMARFVETVRGTRK